MHRVAGVVIAISIMGVPLVGCSTSPGSVPRACAIFDRSFARWDAAVGDLPRKAQRSPRLAAADARLLGALDQATSEAGATALGSALQSVAAGVRQLDGAQDNHDAHAAANARRLITLAVEAVRQTCPRV